MKLEPHFSKRLDLGIKLASSKNHIEVAQRLRYRVFHEELGAIADAKTHRTKRDQDGFDEICDHLLVTRPRTEIADPMICIEHEEVVGTYRLLRQTIAEKHDGFYSQGEYNVQSLLARKSDFSFLELGRSCVLAQYRGTPVIELLWQGIWNYVRQHKIDVMFGCASFEGTDIASHAETLSFLGNHTNLPEDWHVRAHDQRYVDMKVIPADAIDCRKAMLSLPPLIKGYLRLGSFIGEGAVIDHAFNTIDVLVVLPIASIKPRYFAHFGAPTS